MIIFVNSISISYNPTILDRDCRNWQQCRSLNDSDISRLFCWTIRHPADRILPSGARTSDSAPTMPKFLSAPGQPRLCVYLAHTRRRKTSAGADIISLVPSILVLTRFYRSSKNSAYYLLSPQTPPAPSPPRLNYWLSSQVVAVCPW